MRHVAAAADGVAGNMRYINLDTAYSQCSLGGAYPARVISFVLVSLGR
jgi:hypothetical protein